MIITGLIGLHVESRRRDNRSRRPDRIEFPGERTVSASKKRQRAEGTKINDGFRQITRNERTRPSPFPSYDPSLPLWKTVRILIAARDYSLCPLKMSESGTTVQINVPFTFITFFFSRSLSTFSDRSENTISPLR